MTNPFRNDDTRLLLAIAGVIVTGAAGIALIAGIGESPPEPRRVERSPIRTAPVPPSPEPIID